MRPSRAFSWIGTITENVPVEDYVLFDVMQEAYDAYSAREVNDCQPRRGSVFGGAPALFVLCVALAERTRYNKELNPRRGERHRADSRTDDCVWATSLYVALRRKDSLSLYLLG